MLITGILITIVAIFMLLVPQFFMKLKSPRSSSIFYET